MNTQRSESATEQARVSATTDMIADLGLTGDDAVRLQSVLASVAALADQVPAPSDDVRVLLAGAVPLCRRRRAGVIAASAAALAFGGVSAAAAANRLPDPIQEFVASTTDGVLPIPHPVKPTNPPFDAPGHVRNKPKLPKPSKRPHPTPSVSAPGQIQKSTKPAPRASGPARPANPGSHGRAHHDSTSDTTHGSSKSDHSGSSDHSGHRDSTPSQHGKH